MIGGFDGLRPLTVDVATYVRYTTRRLFVASPPLEDAGMRYRLTHAAMHDQPSLVANASPCAHPFRLDRPTPDISGEGDAFTTTILSSRSASGMSVAIGARICSVHGDG